MTKRLLLSIIIVNYNTKNPLGQCLNSLAKHPTKHSEIIVADNASTDGSVEMVRKEFSEITLVANKTNKGFGAANNQGAKIAKGEYFLFLNPDTIIDRGFGEVVAYMEKHPKVGILGCRLADEKGEEQPHIAEFKHSVFSAVVDKISPLAKGHLGGLRGGGIGERDIGVTDIDWVTGACTLVRRHVFEELSGFDERFFMYFEDEDLCLRAKERGWRVVYYPKFTITHIGGASLRKDRKSRWNHYFQSQDLFYKKHHGVVQNILLKVLRWPLRIIFRN